MANDLNAAVEQVNATVAKCLAEVQQTRVKIDAGEVRAADLDTKIHKMDEAIKSLDGGLAAARAQAAAQPALVAGDVSKRFAEKGGGVRLFDGVVERRLEGSPEPIRRTAEGYLSSADTLSAAHSMIARLEALPGGDRQRAEQEGNPWSQNDSSQQPEPLRLSSRKAGLVGSQAV